jgi:hypothetical protein
MGGRRGTRTLDPFLVRAECGTNECPITSQYVAPARGSANDATRRDTSTAHKLRTPLHGEERSWWSELTE